MPTTSVTSIMIAVALSLGTSGVRAQAPTPPETTPNEEQLIAVLKSDAPLKAKADACRMLAQVGTRKAVPALVALLDHDKLSHMARYALEPIPDRAVDAALGDALGRLKGKALVGVIGSIGVRRNTSVTRKLGALLQASDAAVAQAAARSLGRFGTPPATDVLLKALTSAPAGNRPAVFEGLLRCAEALAAGDQQTKAIAVYDRLRGLTKAPHQVRTAALRGAVLTRGDAGLSLLREALRSKDAVLVTAAARTSLEMPGAAVTKALAGELGTLPSDSQVLVTMALGKRRDSAALPALIALTTTGSRAAAREAVVRALVEIGDAAAVPALVALLDDPSDDVVQTARDALAAMTKPEVDAALVAMLSHNDAKARNVAVELLGRRGAVSTLPALLKAAAGDDASIRMASIQALGAMAGRAEFPALVRLLVNAQSPQELRALEDVVSQLCLRHSRPAPGEVVIRKAVYGDIPSGASADVTATVTGVVTKGSLLVEASNANFGDPAQGTTKKLRVEYTVRGKTRTETVNEGQTLVIQGGTAPQAFIDALRAALPQAAPDAKQALQRILRSTAGSAP